MYVQEKPTHFYANKNKANQCSAPVSIIAMRTITFLEHVKSQIKVYMQVL